MVADRHQIGVQRRGFRPAGCDAAHHPERIRGVIQGGVRRNGREAPTPAVHSGRKDGRTRQELQRHIQIIAIRQKGHKRAHRFQRRQTGKVGAGGPHPRKHLHPGVAQSRFKTRHIWQVLEKAIQQQVGRGRERCAPRQLIQAVAANNQSAGGAIHIGQNRVGGDHAL
jgi:hypothetical protein